MKYIIANWKMQLSEAESKKAAKEMVRLWSAQAEEHPEVRMVICPGPTPLETVGDVLGGTNIALGAQDVFWEEKGAYTGEISPKTLKEVGCEYCIAGHSERREYMGETDEMVNKKTKALLKYGMVPIICVGETRAERDEGRKDAVVISQVKAALEGVSLVGNQKIIVAYEPRWVIGTGQAVSPDDAASMHHLINETIKGLYPSAPKDQFTVIYGGSADSKNIAGFMAMDVINGVLVGTAALNVEEFIRMAEIMADMAGKKK